MLTEILRLRAYAEWADRLLLGALQSAPEVPVDAVNEYAHILGAVETWLARLEGRVARVAIWPAVGVSELPRLCDAVHADFARYITALDPSALDRVISYQNSVGQKFDTSVTDILLHVSLHSQYHRGKVNLLLRQASLSPVPVDYIGFVRGVAAATKTVPAGS